MKGTPLEEQFMSWNEMIQPPYDKNNVDAFTRTRVILMNGIENNSVLTSHCMDRMIDNDEIKRVLSGIRRVDSQQQQTVDWLNPANQSVVETTIGYEQVAVELTSNLARNEPDGYFRQVLDFALLEDFDHLRDVLQGLRGEERLDDPEDSVRAVHLIGAVAESRLQRALFGLKPADPYRGRANPRRDALVFGVRLVVGLGGLFCLVAQTVEPGLRRLRLGTLIGKRGC
jgi:uncharacterized membrane protein YccC